MAPESRDALLDRIRRYAHESGIGGITFERISAALGISRDKLREYFESEVDLVTALVANNRVRLREALARSAAKHPTGRALRTAMWRAYLDSADDAVLFFEAYGIAMHDEQYRVFLTGVDDWIELLRAGFLRRGATAARATALATLTLAAYRGAMLDYCVTRDRARVNAAMEQFLDLLERAEGTAG